MAFGLLVIREQVLKLGVIQGVQACSLGVTILAEELERDAAA